MAEIQNLKEMLIFVVLATHFHSKGKKYTLFETNLEIRDGKHIKLHLCKL